MPAIQPAKLRLQAASLAELRGQPQAFVRFLRGLLELYADRTHRAGQAGEPPPLMTSYNVPQPVLRQVLHEMRPRLQQDLPTTLALCQVMWAEPYFEIRLLATHLLGMAPVQPAEPVMALLRNWLVPPPEERLLEPLFEHGLKRMRQEYPAGLLQLSREWLVRPWPDPKSTLIYQQYALRLLRPLTLDPAGDLLPQIYPLIVPLLRAPPPDLRPDLLDLLEAMAQRSPQETAFVLRQNLDSPDNAQTAWLIRQVLDEFPPAQQESLKEAMRKM